MRRGAPVSAEHSAASAKRCAERWPSCAHAQPVAALVLPRLMLPAPHAASCAGMLKPRWWMPFSPSWLRQSHVLSTTWRQDGGRASAQLYSYVLPTQKRSAPSPTIERPVTRPADSCAFPTASAESAYVAFAVPAQTLQILPERVSVRLAWSAGRSGEHSAGPRRMAAQIACMRVVPCSRCVVGMASSARSRLAMLFVHMCCVRG